MKNIEQIKELRKQAEIAEQQNDKKNLSHIWNQILYLEGLDAVQPGKPNRKETEKQKVYKRKGVPKWGQNTTKKYR